MEREREEKSLRSCKGLCAKMRIILTGQKVMHLKYAAAAKTRTCARARETRFSVRVSLRLRRIEQRRGGNVK